MFKLVTKAILISAISLSATASSDAGIKSKLALVAGGIVARGVVQGCLKTPQCKAAGARKAGEAAMAIVSKYGPDAVKTCMSNSTCMNTLFAAVAAGSVSIPLLKQPDESDYVTDSAGNRRYSPGENMQPPGRCEPDELAMLSGRVNKYCKQVRPNKCTPADDVFDIDIKIMGITQCMNARIEREDRCFNGGNSTHRTEIANTKKQLQNCEKLKGGVY